MLAASPSKCGAMVSTAPPWGQYWGIPVPNRQFSDSFEWMSVQRSRSELSDGGVETMTDTGRGRISHYQDWNRCSFRSFPKRDTDAHSPQPVKLTSAWMRTTWRIKQFRRSWDGANVAQSCIQFACLVRVIEARVAKGKESLTGNLL